MALPLDAVDGWVARRTGTASALGARFDMEVDAVLMLVLSVLRGRVARAVGARGRPACATPSSAPGWLLPWLRRRCRRGAPRKVVAAAQGVVLAVAVAGVLPVAVAGPAVGLALAALVWSFGRDVALLAPAAGPYAARNRSRKESIRHTGAFGAGRRPSLHPQPEMRSSTAGS